MLTFFVIFGQRDMLQWDMLQRDMLQRVKYYLVSFFYYFQWFLCRKNYTLWHIYTQLNK
jgi:hypothetical protein